MLEDLRFFVENLVRRYGPFKVIMGPYAVVLALIEFGVLSSSSSQLIASSAMSLVISVVVMVALLSLLHRSQDQLVRHERIINQLTESLMDAEAVPPYTLDSWEDRVTISHGGDAIIEQWVTARVSSDQSLRVMWLGLEQTGGPMTGRQRHRVTVQVRNFTITATGSREPGATYPTVQSWDGNGLKVYPYFERFFAPGSLCRLHLQWTWPGHYAYLLSGGSDEAGWMRKRTGLKYAATHLIFDPSCGMRKGFVMRSLGGGDPPIQVIHGDGTVEILASYGGVDSVSPLPSIVGFVLERSSR